MFDLFESQKPPDTFHIKVTPKAKSERIKRDTAADGTLLFKVYVTVAAEDGKANAAVIALLAKALGVPKSSITIIHGLKHREKKIKVNY